MRSLLTGCGLLLAVICSAQDRDKATILGILDRQTQAWNRGDLENFMKGYWKSDSLCFIGKSGVTYGWQNTLNNYQKGYPDTAAMGKLKFDILSVQRLSADYFHIIGKWQLQRTAGNLSGHYTLLFRRINGEWVIVADHSS
jgi:ketosteroid isomerase-like protein